MTGFVYVACKTLKIVRLSEVSEIEYQILSSGIRTLDFTWPTIVF